jgi:uncharacterized protein (TIGR03067 family)
MKSRAAFVVAAILLAGCPHSPQGPKTADQGDVKQMEGEWLSVAVEQAGEKVPEDTLKKNGSKTTIADGKMDILTDGKPDQVSFTLDPTKSPKGIDTVALGGSRKGKVTLGIYKLEGDRLTMCVRLKGEGRPTEFATKQGSGDMLMVFERVKK